METELAFGFFGNVDKNKDNDDFINFCIGSKYSWIPMKIKKDKMIELANNILTMCK